MMSPEFRTKLEDIMRDWYAANDSGEMHLADLASAIADIAKQYNPKNPEMPGMGVGMMGAMMGVMFSGLGQSVESKPLNSHDEGYLDLPVVDSQGEKP